MSSFVLRETFCTQAEIMCTPVDAPSRDVPDIRQPDGRISRGFLLSGSGSGPVVPRNRISEPDNSSAQMSPNKLN